VTLIIAGTVRAPPRNMEALRPHMIAMMTASRGEDGCRVYGYAEDVAVPGLIHVFEIWRDQEALAAHGRSGHMAAWRAAAAELGLSGRDLAVYEVASERPL
jgi:quinol monooxygenase YgiN